MGPNNFYRCNNDIYYCSIDESIAISYSLNKTEGKPKTINQTYRKIKEGPRFFLSPYTLWHVTLNMEANKKSLYQSQIQELKTFKSETITIELRGRGQNVRSNTTTSDKYCKPTLKNYYKSVITY